MSNILRLPLVALVGLCLALSACGGSSIKTSTDPQVRKQEEKAQALIQSCARKANFITHAGRQGFIACIAPKGKGPAVEKCAQGKFAHDGVLTKHARRKLEQDLVTCVVGK